MSSGDGGRKFWKWMYYLASDWQPPDIEGAERFKVAGYAVFIATYWGKEGKKIHPSHPTVAKAYKTNVRTIKRLHRQAIDAGILRKTGQWVRNVPVVEINIPGAEPEPAPATVAHIPGATVPRDCPQCVAEVAHDGRNGAEVWQEHLAGVTLVSL